MNTYRIYSIKGPEDHTVQAGSHEQAAEIAESEHSGCVVLDTKLSKED